MSAQNPYENDPFRSNPYSQSQPPRSQSDFKASHDDLIDDYSAPYAPSSRHQTFNIGSQSQAHHRGHSITLSHKGTILSSKQSDETHDTASFAYPPATPAKDKDVEKRTIWQKIIPESLACRLYVATVLVETTIDLAIEGELFLRVREKSQEGDTGGVDKLRMPVYLSIFALAHVFQLVMALDAVYARNTLQFICLAVFNALFLLYAIIQINEIKDAVADSTTAGLSNIPINVLTTIIPIVISIAEIAYIGLGWKIYNEFGWKVYKFLGADRRIKKMYANYQIYECLVKFDVFFWAGFSVQFIWLVLSDTDPEYYITCAALPLSIVLLIEGHLAARHENKWMMATFMSGCVAAMIYFIYKLIKVLLLNQNPQFIRVWKSLTVFSVIAIVLLVITFVYSVIILKNFGRGLKDALTRKAQGRENQPHRRGPSATLNRMSIN